MKRPLAAAALVALTLFAACATGDTIADDTGALGVFDGGAGGLGISSGGGPATGGGVGAGGLGSGGAIGSGGTPPGAGGLSAGGQPGGGGASSGGTPVDAGGDAGCPPGAKECAEVCMLPNPEFGCGLNGCGPRCPDVPNAERICVGEACSFECAEGYHLDDAETGCDPDVTGAGGTGSGGGGSGGSSSGGASSGGASSGGSSSGGASSGGAGTGGSPPSCGACPICPGIPCCKANGTCGCSWFVTGCV